MDVRHEIRHLAWRDHRPPDGHVRLLGIRRLAEAVVDDRAQLRGREAVTDVLQSRNVRRDAAFALLAVTGRARELDEQVRTHRDVRIARVRARAASPAAASGRGRLRRGMPTMTEADRRDVAGHRPRVSAPPTRNSTRRISRSRARSAPRRELAEVAAQRAVARGRAGDVVLGPAKLEVSVPRRPGRTRTSPSSGMPTLPGLTRCGPVRPRPPELQMAVAEDDRPVAHAGEHALVVLATARPESSRRPRAASRGRRGSRRARPAAAARRASRRARRRTSPRKTLVRLHHLRPVERRLSQPALAVAADPGRVRKLPQPRERLVGPGLGVP